MAIEFEAGLVIIAGPRVIIKGPAAASMNQMADLVLLTRPKTLHAALFTHGAPLIDGQVTVLVKRSRELVSALPAAFRKVMVAGKFQSNVLQWHKTLRCVRARAVAIELYHGACLRT